MQCKEVLTSWASVLGGARLNSGTERGWGASQQGQFLLPSLLRPGHGTTPTQRISTLVYNWYGILEVVAGEATSGKRPVRGIRTGGVALDVLHRVVQIVVADVETWLLTMRSPAFYGSEGLARLRPHHLAHFMRSITDFFIHGITPSLRLRDGGLNGIPYRKGCPRGGEKEGQESR